MIQYLILASMFAALTSYSDAYDPLDPDGNITIVWDIMSWTDDGYKAGVALYNYQQYRHIEPPGWMLGWTWAGNEIIWRMNGAETTMQGDCSKVHTGSPHNCERNPTIVDLMPGDLSQQLSSNNEAAVANCCKGGVLTSMGQDPTTALARFQLKVGLAGNRTTAVMLPRNFTLQAPGPGYTCGPAERVPVTLFPATDGRRSTQAFLTWNVTCTYSQFIAQRAPSCCVSLSSFYSDDIVSCPVCSCDCQVGKKSCIQSVSRGGQQISSAIQTSKSVSPIIPILNCTQDMCPIRVHWHVKQNYRQYWRVKLTVSNRNYAQNYSQWTIVAQHPNLSNVTEVFSFNHKSLPPYHGTSNAAMFWGIREFNDMLLQAGDEGSVQSEILFQKDPETFTFRNGWAFPERVYFNGDACVLPPPDAYPALPNGTKRSWREKKVLSGLVIATIVLLIA